MFKEYKPSEKCYISDLLQIIKTMAAAPCGTERDIIQQENELYKTISVISYSAVSVACKKKFDVTRRMWLVAPIHNNDN